jgi:hypothetical protein
MKNTRHQETKGIKVIIKITKITNRYKQIKLVIDQKMTRYKHMIRLSEVITLLTKTWRYVY